MLLNGRSIQLAQVPCGLLLALPANFRCDRIGTAKIITIALRIMTQHDSKLYIFASSCLAHCTKCPYRGYPDAIVMLSVIIFSVIMLRVFVLSVAKLNVIMYCDILRVMLSAFCRV